MKTLILTLTLLLSFSTFAKSKCESKAQANSQVDALVKVHNSKKSTTAFEASYKGCKAAEDEFDNNKDKYNCIKKVKFKKKKKGFECHILAKKGAKEKLKATCSRGQKFNLDAFKKNESGPRNDYCGGSKGDGAKCWICYVKKEGKRGKAKKVRTSVASCRDGGSVKYKDNSYTIYSSKSDAKDDKLCKKPESHKCFACYKKQGKNKTKFKITKVKSSDPKCDDKSDITKGGKKGWTFVDINSSKEPLKKVCEDNTEKYKYMYCVTKKNGKAKIKAPKKKFVSEKEFRSKYKLSESTKVYSYTKDTKKSIKEKLKKECNNVTDKFKYMYCITTKRGKSKVKAPKKKFASKEEFKTKYNLGEEVKVYSYTKETKKSVKEKVKAECGGGGDPLKFLYCYYNKNKKPKVKVVKKKYASEADFRKDKGIAESVKVYAWNKDNKKSQKEKALLDCPTEDDSNACYYCDPATGIIETVSEDTTKKKGLWKRMVKQEKICENLKRGQIKRLVSKSKYLPLEKFLNGLDKYYSKGILAQMTKNGKKIFKKVKEAPLFATKAEAKSWYGKFGLESNNKCTKCEEYTEVQHAIAKASCKEGWTYNKKGCVCEPPKGNNNLTCEEVLGEKYKKNMKLLTQKEINEWKTLCTKKGGAWKADPEDKTNGLICEFKDFTCPFKKESTMNIPKTCKDYPEIKSYLDDQGKIELLGKKFKITNENFFSLPTTIEEKQTDLKNSLKKYTNISVETSVSGTNYTTKVVSTQPAFSCDGVINITKETAGYTFDIYLELIYSGLTAEKTQYGYIKLKDSDLPGLQVCREEVLEYIDVTKSKSMKYAFSKSRRFVQISSKYDFYYLRLQFGADCSIVKHQFRNLDNLDAEGGVDIKKGKGKKKVTENNKEIFKDE
jgi:hypothetical protein